MPSLPSQLSARIESATGVDPQLRPSTKPQFGHFQSNVALRLAKQEGRPPRDVAADIVAKGRLGPGQMIAVDGGQHLAWRTPDIQE
mgnify:CR=1 FL=1